MNAPAVLELPLDDALLKVLSSESRREILRLLRERRMTGAELAQRLELGKPAVAEHLKKLQEAALIERIDDPERRWVYYSLSARGRGILEPQRVRFYLVMAVAALGLMVGVVLGLGLVVLLQSTGTIPDGLGTPAGEGAGVDPNVVRPGLGAGDPIPAGGVATTPEVASTTTSGQDPMADDGAASHEPGEGALPAEDATSSESTGDGSVQPSPRPSSVIDSTTPFFLLHPTGSKQGLAKTNVTTVLVYRAKDVDATNNTLRLTALDLDEAARAGINVTQEVLDAATVPGVGVLLEVPDDVRLPEAGNATATLVLPSLGTQPGSSTSTAQAAPRDSLAPQTPMGPDSQPVVTSTLSSDQQPGEHAATTPPDGADTPQGVPTPASGEDTDSAQSSGGGAAGKDAPGLQVGTVEAASGRVNVAVPLVAALAALVVASIHLPNRRLKA